jgi:hypothetical protein
MRHSVPVALFAIIAITLSLPSEALADKQVVERVQVTNSPDDTISKTTEIITWIGEERFSRIDRLNNVTTIVRRDLSKMYIVFHDHQDVVEIKLPFDLPAQLQPLFREVGMSWTLNRLPDRKKIGQWDCTKVLIKGRGALTIDLELWVTPDTGIDTRAFHAMVGESLQASKIYRDMGEKLYGISPNFSIRTITTVEQLGMRVTTVSDVQSIEEKTAPAGTYDPPADYTVKPLDYSTYLSLVRERQPSPGGQ